MVTQKELEDLIIEIEEDNNKDAFGKKATSWQEEKERIKDWTTLFRRNLDIFNQDFLEIGVTEFQKLMINSISDNEVSVNICSRGIGKIYFA